MDYCDWWLLSTSQNAEMEAKKTLEKSENCADKWICNFMLHYVAYGDMFIYAPNNVMWTH